MYITVIQSVKIRFMSNVIKFEVFPQIELRITTHNIGSNEYLPHHLVTICEPKSMKKIWFFQLYCVYLHSNMYQ